MRLKKSFKYLICLILLTGILPVGVHAEETDVPQGYVLEEVVVLSRHNIRAPLSTTGSALDAATPHTWTEWSSNASELSLRGGMLETSMGQYFRKWLEEEELIPENYRPQGEEVRFYANAKQRTIATAQYFSSGFLPVANVEIETNQEYDRMDPVFEPALTFLNDAYAEECRKQMAEKETDLTGEYALLSRVTDLKDSLGYKNGSVTDFETGDSEYLLEIGKEPGVSGSLKTATTLSDALVLQYYETADAKEAAFGHDLSFEDWKSIAEIKDIYCQVLFGTPLLSAHVAHPLLKVIDAELERTDRKFCFLCGHDSNLTSVLAALETEEYELDGAIEADTPIGSKAVFEKWKDPAGKEYIRVRMIYESADQLRAVPLLDLRNPPEIRTLSFHGLNGENGLYPLKEFDDRLNQCIRAYYDQMNAYGISSAGIPDTADR